MKLLTKIILIFIFQSCTTIKTSLVRENDVLTTQNPSSYKIVGSINLIKYYFDPLASSDKFHKKVQEILHSKIPDSMYDLEGDTGWITDFDITHHNLSCLGLCSKLGFKIMVLKHK